MFIPDEYLPSLMPIEEAVSLGHERFFAAMTDITLWRDDDSFNTFVGADGTVYRGYSYRLFVRSDAIVSSSATTSRTCMIDVRDGNVLVATLRQKSVADILRPTFDDADYECDELHIGDQLVLKNEQRGRHHV